MPGLTITSANAIYTLSVDTVFPTPQQLQGFGVDEAFDTEMADLADVVLGVDGIAVAGWRPRLTRQTITLLAASPSFGLFETWQAAMDNSKEIFYATGLIQLPAIGRQYALPQGTLTRYPALPNARRTLQDRRFEIVWAWPIVGSNIPVG